MYPYAPIIFLTALAALSTKGRAEESPLWVVVGHEKLQRAAAPLIELRRREGFRVALTKPPVRAALSTLERPPDYLLLLGDDLLAPDPPADLLASGPA